MQRIEQTRAQTNETSGIVELNEQDLSLVSGGMIAWFYMNGYAVLVSANGPGQGGVVLTGSCYKGECTYTGGTHF
jgi:hypothetical protein